MLPSDWSDEDGCPWLSDNEGQRTPGEWPLWAEGSPGLAQTELDGKWKSLALQTLAWVGPLWFQQPPPSWSEYRIEKSSRPPSQISLVFRSGVPISRDISDVPLALTPTGSIHQVLMRSAPPHWTLGNVCKRVASRSVQSKGPCVVLKADTGRKVWEMTQENWIYTQKILPVFLGVVLSQHGNWVI